MAAIKVWAHRGASAYAPENTIDAFSRAVKLHADGVELDVQLSRDGELVVAHDERLERVSNGTGYLKDYTLQELKKMNFNRTNADYDFAQIATLAEVYELLAPTDLTINVELKTGMFPYEGIEEKVLRLTDTYGLNDRVIYSSFRHESLRNIYSLRPGTPTGILYSDGWYGITQYAKRTIHACALHPALLHLMDPQYVENAHKARLKVHAWTADTPEEMELCVRAGVDAIITGKPDLCRITMSDMA